MRLIGLTSKNQEGIFIELSLLLSLAVQKNRYSLVKIGSVVGNIRKNYYQGG